MINVRFDFRRSGLSGLHFCTCLRESPEYWLLSQRAAGNGTYGSPFDPDADHPKETHLIFVVLIYFLSFFLSVFFPQAVPC